MNHGNTNSNNDSHNDMIDNQTRESIEVRGSRRVVLGNISKHRRCGVLLTLVSCCPRSLRDLPP